MTFPAAASSSDAISRVKEIVRNLCGRLQLDANIEIRIDENNDRMVSTEPLAGPGRGYQISLDRRFLESLNDEEMTGAIAHELGHVWIFTHHPYLQTEEGANEIAMRVVTRDTMKQVYSRLWARTGVPGTSMSCSAGVPAERSKSCRGSALRKIPESHIGVFPYCPGLRPAP